MSSWKSVSLIFLLVVAGGVLVLGRPAFACTCPGYISFPDAMDASDIVLRGRVLEVHPEDDGPLNVAIVEVSRYWKDTTEQFAKNIEVLDPPDGWCASGLGFSEAVGQEWVIFAEVLQWGVVTDECIRTMEWQFAEYMGYVESLGPPIVILATPRSGWGMLKAHFGTD